VTGSLTLQAAATAPQRLGAEGLLAEQSPGDPVQAAPGSQRTSSRTDEETRQQLTGRMAAAFPHPTTFTAAEVLKTLPELGGYQSAYAFLQTARRRGLVEKAERGAFRLTTTAQGPQPAPDRAAEKAPEPTPAPVEVPSPRRAPVAAPPSTPKPAAPAGEPRNEQAEIANLLQLSRRYRSDKYFRLDDILIPLRECRSEIYGKAELGAGDAPLCVVVAAYEPDMRVLNPQDIEVLFLDAQGQAHLRSAASWQFIPYRRRPG
jgi:hypothetical protein